MASLLADQGTLADLSSKFAGRIPVRIHFLDNSSKVFLSEPNTTSIKDLVTQCLEKYGVLDVANVLPYYSLYESRNGGAIDGHLAMDLKVQDVIQSWADAGVSKTAKFLFMVRLFLPSITGLEMRDVVAHHLGKSREELSTVEYLEHAEVIDSNALHLQFIQAVYNVITGRYPTTAEEALKLGAVHFLLKFGRFSADKHKIGFLSSRIFEFIPIKHLKSGGGSKALSSSATADWEGKLYEEVKRVSADLAESDVVAVNEEVDEEGGIAGADVSNGANLLFRLHGKAVSAQRLYLESVYKMEPVFGATFFKCTQKSVRALPETLQIGVYSDGLHLCDKHKKLLRSFYIEDIFRWGFKPAVMFYFEISPDDDYGTGTLEFDTTEGKEMSDLLTDYALAFLKEREAEELRAQSLGLQSNNHRNTSSSHNGHVPPPPQRATNGHSNGHAVGLLSPSAAAVRIQALYRGFALRNDWAKEDAAILIQAVYRGYRARVLISKLIEDMIQSGQL